MNCMNCSHYDVCFVYNGEYFDIDRNKDTNMKICKYFLDKNILIRPPFKNNDCVYIITKPCFDNKYQIIKCVVHNMRISRNGTKVQYTCKGNYRNGSAYCGNFVESSIGNTVFLDYDSASKKIHRLNISELEKRNNLA